MVAQPDTPFGPWNPGIQSEMPPQLRHLSTIFRSENVSTTLPQVMELRQLTGLPVSELVAFRPQRLVLHELLVRVTANFSVPDGSRIGDLGINFREITGLLLRRYLEPEMQNIVQEFDAVRVRLGEVAREALEAIVTRSAPPARAPTRSTAGRLFERLRRRRSPPQPVCTVCDWGPHEIIECERRAAAMADDPLRSVAYRSLARVMSALFTTNGRAWGTPEMIVAVATDLATNIHGSDVIGRMIGPILRRAAQIEGYGILPRQAQPIVINTKGPSASGKSTLRPLQKKLAGTLGARWSDFALISPDIWRKQLLDYAALGPAFRYAGAFSSEELQIIDQKLDRYMALKHSRGDMAHLLIDRFRFDSFAPDSDEAGSNLLTRFGHSVYLFFVITPPEQLVERAWKRGLEFGRYKAVDDTLAHSVEAYSGMPDVFFTWVRRTDKYIHFEFLDNSVPFGDLPRTIAFGSNYTLNVLDVGRMLDVERFGRVDVNALTPETLYQDRHLLAAQHNIGFLKRCVSSFAQVNFADQASGRVYLQTESGRPVRVERDGLTAASADPSVSAALHAVIPEAFAAGVAGFEQPKYLRASDQVLALSTLGQWGDD